MASPSTLYLIILQIKTLYLICGYLLGILEALRKMCLIGQTLDLSLSRVAESLGGTPENMRVFLDSK